MAEITVAMVKAFREKTGLPMMECKKALVEAQGDEELAIELLRKAGKKTMEKRSGRETEAGRIAVYTAPNGVTAMVELLCESAPVANTPEFVALLDHIVKQLAEGPGAATADELLAQGNLKLEFDDLVNKIREVFRLTRILRVEGKTGTYVHHNHGIGVVLEIEGDNTEMADNICMHVASMAPKAICKEDVDPAVLAKEREIVTEQTKTLNSDKPDNIIAKIAEGRLKTFLSQICLLDQEFVMDTSKTVGQAAKDAGIVIKKMHHWILGK
ncbi:MAG: translation elongation factor Ts [Thermoguttaceae bacterium]|nr:translation elongation factor Ts [Thermoguttaceae bacterium]